MSPPPNSRTAAADERLRIAAVGVASALLALWMDLSPLHRFHDSDSLVPVLMSLQRWTAFYWEQNRFGSLVPLLALPVRSPYLNLLVQVALRLLAVVLSFFLLARTVVPRPYWPAVGAATLALYIAGKGQYAHCFFQMQPYPPAAALALGGVLCLDASRAPGQRKGRRAVRIGAGALLLGLAFWVSPSIVAWLLSLLVLRRVLRLGPAGGEGLFRLLLPFALVCAAFVSSALVTRFLAPWGGTDLALAKITAWPHAWATLAVKSAHFLGILLPLAVAVLAGCAVAAWRSARARFAAAAGLCLLGMAAADLLVLATSKWVHLNELPIRFLWCGFLAAAMALPAMVAALLLEGRPGWWRIANGAALAALVPVMLFRFGPPSPAAARAAFDRHVGPVAPAIVASGCTHVLGSYWRVWPAVLRANQILWEQGSRRQVWGITTRSRPTRDLWQPRSWTAARVGVIRFDTIAATAMSFYSVPPLFLVEAQPTLRVYSGTPPPGAGVVSFPAVVRGPSVAPAASSQEPRP